MAYEKFKKLDGKKHDRRIKAVIGISLEKYGDIVIDGLECSCVRPQNSRRPVTAKRKNALSSRPRRRHDPAPANPFPILRIRRKHS